MSYSIIAPVVAAVVESAAATAAEMGQGSGAALLTAAGTIAGLYRVGATGNYGTMRYSDLNTELIGPDDRPIIVEETLMQALQGAVYEFTHKAVWACWLTLPPGAHTARDIVNSTGLVDIPPTEHWAFVARAEVHVTEPMVAYFIAQFGNGDFIPPPEEADLSGNDRPFRALLQERNKSHAALSIVEGISNTDVWVREPLSNTKRYVYRGGQLVSPTFKAEEWVAMRRPMKLRDLNEYIYTTPCTNRAYSTSGNHCQHFSTALFNAL